MKIPRRIPTKPLQDELKECEEKEGAFEGADQRCLNNSNSLLEKKGPQFTSTLFRELNQLLGSTHIRTTAYHPEANGLVERFQRQLKSATIATSSNINWVERLPMILLALRSTVKEDLGRCPAELVLGTPLRLPGEMICESQYRASVDPSSYATRIKEHFRSVLPTPSRQDSEPTCIHKDLSTSPFVFVRADAVKKSLQPPYDGPYKVLQHNSKYFILDHNGTKDSVSIDRLKPAYLEPRLEHTCLDLLLKQLKSL
nr:gag pol polyprotein [Hymenolepis microstoma]